MNIINFTDTVSLVSTICCYNIAQLNIRPHLTNIQMQPIITDGVAWSLCHSLELAKMTKLIEMSFGV